MSDELVKRWLWAKYKAHEDADSHLKTCETADMDLDMSDGEYGCNSGCEYFRMEAKVWCMCDEVQQTIDYGEFGAISYFVRELEEFEKNPHQPYGRTYGGSEIRIYAW